MVATLRFFNQYDQYDLDLWHKFSLTTFRFEQHPHQSGLVERSITASFAKNQVLLSGSKICNSLQLVKINWARGSKCAKAADERKRGLFHFFIFCVLYDKSTVTLSFYFCKLLHTL